MVHLGHFKKIMASFIPFLDDQLRDFQKNFQDYFLNNFKKFQELLI